MVENLKDSLFLVMLVLLGFKIGVPWAILDTVARLLTAHASERLSIIACFSDLVNILLIIIVFRFVLSEFTTGGSLR